VSIIARSDRLARRLRETLFGSRFILVYHKIEDVDRDPWGLAVSPERFGEHLDVLAAYGACLTFSEMARRSADGTLPRRAVAITFDDGYADNLHQALPRLAERNLPATLFLSPGLLGSGREFWWDELERIVFGTDTLPDRLVLDAGGLQLDISLPYLKNDADPGAWRAWDEPDSSRAFLYLELWKRLRPLPRSTQAEVLDALLDWAGAPGLVRDTHRAMTQAEVARFAGEGVFEIGAHTMTHLSLPAHSAELQSEEMRASKAACSDIAGYEVTSFSYPYGDHDDATVSCARDAGFTAACTTRQALLDTGCDRFRLPRIQAHDWSGENLARKIAVLFN
jgi:peptidoglycan/xylan/chitin deacetylase (PgdA/CDA1 family)